tara:strand:- start:591 stop:2249 length:1659 start_codon:yes stop_codon:yes gene_type:complete
MATADYIISNQSGASFRTDLNNTLAAIVSNNSNSSEPATKYAYQWWADTSAAVMKLRNSANDGWIELFQLDGTLTLEDGSASTPGLAFRDDLNTGIFSSAANHINFSTNGTERIDIGTDDIVINNSGADVDFRIEGNTNANLFKVDAGNDRIGIGVASPNHELEVAGNIGINANLTHNGDTDTRLSFSANDQCDIVCSGTTIGSFTTNGLAVGNNKRLDILDTSGHRSGMINNSDSGANSLRISADPDNSGSSTSLQLHVDGSEVFRVDSSGNCAIGTTTGNNRLEIAKAAHYVVTNSGQARNGIHIRGNGGNENEYGGAISFGCNNTGAAAIAALQGGSDSDQVGLAFFTHSNSSGSVDAAEVARFSKDGEFFIGTTVTNPGFGTSTDNGCYINPSAYIMTARGNGTPAFFSRNGNTGSLVSFNYNGGGQIAEITTNGSSVTYGTGSDYRLKENITTLTNAITRLKNLKPSRFNFLTTPSITQDGFIAHELQEVVPEAVTGVKDEVRTEDGDMGEKKGDPIMQNVDVARIVPLLTAAVQELITRVETLEAA